jgi:hypothetical protein
MAADRKTRTALDKQAEAQQRQSLLDAQRKANKGQPRNFKQDAIDDKVVSVEPDGTGPTSTATFDADKDQAAGSGSG